MLKTNRLTIERDLFVFIWMDRSLISVFSVCLNVAEGKFYLLHFINCSFLLWRPGIAFRTIF